MNFPFYLFNPFRFNPKLFKDFHIAVPDAKPVWLLKAEDFLGLKEYPGSKHNSQILKWWKDIRLFFTDDETPWCAAFVGGILEACSILSSRSAAARSYHKWGFKLDGPAVGAIVVFWRGSPSGWKGHVGIVVGRTAEGHLMVIGGNQGNAVTILPFDVERVLSYRWPPGYSSPSKVGMESLPIINSSNELSINEK